MVRLVRNCRPVAAIVSFTPPTRWWLVGLLPGLLLGLLANPLAAAVDEGQAGAWYMFMWNAAPAAEGRFGWQGDIQHRNWDLGGDLEQLLIRGGRTWRPEGRQSTFTLGYAYIKSGVFGDSDASSEEHRLYQEALIPQRLGRVYLSHRLRLEQRAVEQQTARYRLRYFVAANLPLNRDDLGPGTIYLSAYEELFVNLNRDIGSGRRVDAFDRNRLYLALGYGLSRKTRVQFGYMRQTSSNIDKGQLQFNLLHSF